MTEALLIALTGFLCVSCFIVGAKVGQTVSKGKEIELPNLNPLKAIREGQARKEAATEQDKRNKVLQNIERYDGTSKGQVDVG
jgi:hypothetical protein